MYLPPFPLFLPTESKVASHLARKGAQCLIPIALPALKCSFFASSHFVALAFVASLFPWGSAVLVDLVAASGIVRGFIIASSLFRSSQPQHAQP